MNRQLSRVGLFLGFAFLTVAGAQPAAMSSISAISKAEVNYLLDFIESSGCEFYRNGTWYDSKRAQAHLRDKYETLAAADRISTAEDFIDKAATTSSLSGRRYQVRCRGSAVVTSDRWLRDALARYRTSGAHDAPRVPRGALATDSRFKPEP